MQAPGELTSIDHVLVSAKLSASIDFVDIPHTPTAGVASDHFPVVVRIRFLSPDSGVVVVPARKMAVTRLVPNPSGDEAKNESATLKNLGAEAVDVTGWKLRDLTGKSWKLDSLGTLAAGEEKTIKRNGQEMSLNNGGDTVDLIDPAGVIVQSVTYPSFADDEDEEFEVELPGGPTLVTPQGTDNVAKLRIGALNIEWLGNSDRRSGTGVGVTQSPKDIAGYIKASGVSILALEEISDDDGVAATLTNKTLDAALAVLNAGDEAKWKYRLFPKHPDAENPTWQLTGLAWNEAVATPVPGTAGSADGYRLKLKVPDGVAAGTATKPVFERWATAMKFSAGKGKTDVVVIPVHMKSNRPAFPGQDVVTQREVEAKMLLATLADVASQFADEDIIVLGDTNVLKRDEKAVAAFTSAGFVDLNSADLPTYLSGSWQNPFDRAFVPNPAGNARAKEFASPRFDVFRHPGMTTAEFRKNVSDHRMIRLTVEVSEDDD